MLEYFFNKLKNELGDNIISMSGDILITSAFGNSYSILNKIDENKLNEAVEIVKNKYSFLDLEKSVGLSEIYIRLFCNKKRTAEEDFLNCFNDNIINFIKHIQDDNDGIIVRVNITANFETLNKHSSVRYLNKKDDLRYIVISEKETTSKFKQLYRIKVQLLLLCISVLVYLGWREYGNKILELLKF